jgi:flagellar assembly factor FliW
MNRNVISKEDARNVVQGMTGKLFPVDEIIIIHPADFLEIEYQPDPPSVYFGNIVIESYSTDLTQIILKLQNAGGKTTFNLFGPGTLNPVGSNIQCVVFDVVDTFSEANISFHGWKFTK